MYSAYWFWPQYRRRYGKKGREAEGFLQYLQHVIPAFNRCLQAASEGAFGRGEARSAAEHPRGKVGRWELEQCAVNFESLSSDNEGVYYHADQLLKSLYAAYVPTWLEAFGRKRLLLLRAEDYWRDPRATLRTTLDFLELGMAPSEAAIEAALAKPITPLHGSNATFWGDRSIANLHASVPPNPSQPGHVMSRIRAPMLPDARKLLDGFFTPLNAQLARLLGDERFTWADILQRDSTGKL